MVHQHVEEIVEEIVEVPKIQIQEVVREQQDGPSARRGDCGGDRGGPQNSDTGGGPRATGWSISTSRRLWRRSWRSPKFRYRRWSESNRMVHQHVEEIVEEIVEVPKIQIQE